MIKILRALMEKGDKNRCKQRDGNSKRERDFPGGPVIKNPSCNAGDVGSIPCWRTKIPHAEEQLSLCAATTEPACCGAPAPQPAILCTTARQLV